MYAFPFHHFSINRLHAFSIQHNIKKHKESIYACKTLFTCIKECVTFSQHKESVLLTFHVSLPLSRTSFLFLKSDFHPHFMQTVLSSTILNWENHLSLTRSNNIQHCYTRNLRNNTRSSQCCTILPPFVQSVLRLPYSFTSFKFSHQLL